MPWNKMKPALCFNSKKLQNIYKLDAITTADSATILNNKKRPQILAKPQSSPLCRKSPGVQNLCKNDRVQSQSSALRRTWD